MASFRSVFGIIVALASVVDALPNLVITKLAVAAKAKEQAEADKVDAKKAKTAAVDKVITMLENLQDRVAAEGREEAEAYNKIACFCTDTKKEKTSDIQVETNDKISLSANIQKLVEERGGLQEAIAALTEDIKIAGDEIAAAERENTKAASAYVGNKAEMSDALRSLEDAIKVVKSSKSSFVELHSSVGKTVTRALLMYDALGLGDDGSREAAQKAASMFLQQDSGQPTVEMENYKFHSSGVIEQLETLFDDFRKQAHTLDADEAKRVQDFKLLTQMKENDIKLKTRDIEAVKKVALLGKVEESGTNTQELSTVSELLVDDQEFLDSTSKMCDEKAKTWEQRSRVRSTQLSALAEAIVTIKNLVAQHATAGLAQTGASIKFADSVASSDSAMEAIEAEAESVERPATSFLQKRAVRSRGPNDEAQRAIISLFRVRGQELRSTALTSIASEISADPFAKVKQVIEQQLEKLHDEMADDSSKENWCLKAKSEAEQKRDNAADELGTVNAKLAKLQALSDKLGEELAALKDQTADLNDRLAETEQEREVEKVQNAEDLKEAKEGRDAIKMATEALTSFLGNAAKDAAKAKKDNVKDTYSGDQGNSEMTGILGILDILQTDFERALTEAEEVEKEAHEGHLEFTTEIEKSLAEKAAAATEKTTLKDDADKSAGDLSDSLDANAKDLKAAIEELMNLKESCSQGTTAADRIAKLKEEVEALKKGLCMLGGDISC